MYIRVTRIHVAPEALEQSISNFKERVIPALKSAPGYAGATMLINRETGEGAGVTYWESVEALAASDDVGISARTQAAATAGFTVTDVDRFELVLMDRAKPPSPSFTRVTEGHAPLDKVDQVVALIRDRLLPHRHCGAGS